MDSDKLIKNMVDQIVEAQIKLGYVKETFRVYYPLTSLNSFLGTEAGSIEEMLTLLNEEPAFSDTVLGKITFKASRGRIEVSIPPEGTEYVYREVPVPDFLRDIIDLFGRNHHCTLDDIRRIFEKYSNNYVCEKMPDGMDFDFVLHFNDPDIDPYYYCIKEEMGHTIYHRFTETDYLDLLN